jgi:DNA-binding transcriptional ArsR family regulator
MTQPDSLTIVLDEVRDMGPVTVAGVVSGTGLARSTVRRALIVLESDKLIESDTYQQRRGRVYFTPDV